MYNREIDANAETNARLARRSEDQGSERPEGVLQHVPSALLEGRPGNHQSIITPSTGAAEPSRADQSILRLQRRYGNRYVQRILRLARKSEGAMQLTPEVEETIHRSRGGGRSLDGQVRTQMESSIGADFSGVRIHTDPEADSLSRSVNARAFTVGRDVYFRQGAYEPGSSSGRELLAHELTHVVQQSGGDGVHRKLTVSQPGDSHEQEADQVAQAVIRLEQRPAAALTTAPAVHRQAEEEKKDEGLQTKLEDGALQREMDEDNKEE
jgi:hypothetical protein